MSLQIEKGQAGNQGNVGTQEDMDLSPESVVSSSTLSSHHSNTVSNSNMTICGIHLIQGQDDDSRILLIQKEVATKEEDRLDFSSPSMVSRVVVCLLFYMCTHNADLMSIPISVLFTKV